MTAYYNEIEPFAVAWLRELIREGVIADGIVDDRSIEVVQPSDLNGFTQCHFFAGIGVWSYALRRAGWSDDRPVWTGSCPCQPFSSAGKEEGFADPRHLWPSWFRLAREHRPVTIFGEQVERAIRSHWLDLVSTDLEAEGYAVGSTVFGAHSVGAPNQRQRLYFVANRNVAEPDDHVVGTGGLGRLGASADGAQREARSRLRSDSRDSGSAFVVADTESGHREISIPGRRPDEGRLESGRTSRLIGMADNDTRGLGVNGRSASDGGQAGVAHAEFSGESGGLSESEGEQCNGAGNTGRGRGEFADNGDTRDGLVNAERPRLERHDGYVDHWDEPRRLRTFAAGSTTPTGILGGFWDGAEWVECTDGKARPVEPGSFPLAYGSPARVGRLRGYGNAINSEAAVAFIEAYREVKGEL